MKYIYFIMILPIIWLSSCTTTADLTGRERDLLLTDRLIVEDLDLDLFWNDEFEGSKLSDEWVLADVQRRGGFWHPDSVNVQDGSMRISTYYDESTGKYIDGCASTIKKDFSYGYYSARIKMKKGVGHWGAFWIWNHPYEIDIMEKPFTGDKVHQALHWYSPAIEKDHIEKSIDISSEGLDNEWHIYSVLWQPDSYIFYIDGVKTWELDSTKVDISDVPGEIIFSDEINNGVWIGNGDIKKNKDLPDYMDVDWVRVYTQPE